MCLVLVAGTIDDALYDAKSVSRSRLQIKLSCNEIVYDINIHTCTRQEGEEERDGERANIQGQVHILAPKRNLDDEDNVEIGHLLAGIHKIPSGTSTMCAQQNEQLRPNKRYCWLSIKHNNPAGL